MLWAGGVSCHRGQIELANAGWWGAGLCPARGVDIDTCETAPRGQAGGGRVAVVKIVVLFSGDRNM